MASDKKYVYGPILSRRLGRSLGVDIVPMKVCTQSCIYCQLGRTVNKTVERKEYVPAEPIIAEVTEALSQNKDIDFITIAGSGEPTLNSQLGKIIENIKNISDIPVAIVTNGTLLYRADVRAECAKADVVMPSLDAGDEQVFRKINRPHPDISIEKLISGLCTFREEYSGQIWLEVFLLESVNDYDDEIARIRTIIRRIRPDKVQLNTAVRPAAEKNVRKLDALKLEKIAEKLGPTCEVIADFSHDKEPADKVPDDFTKHFPVQQKAEALLSMLKRRPCPLNDICSSLNMHPNEAMKYLSDFQQRGVIQTEEIDGKIFFKAVE